MIPRCNALPRGSGLFELVVAGPVHSRDACDGRSASTTESRSLLVAGQPAEPKKREVVHEGAERLQLGARARTRENFADHDLGDRNRLPLLERRAEPEVNGASSPPEKLDPRGRVDDDQNSGIGSLRRMASRSPVHPIPSSASAASYGSIFSPTRYRKA